MEDSDNHRFSTISGVVTDQGGQHGPIVGADITVFEGEYQKVTRTKPPREIPIFRRTKTDSAGRFEIPDVPAGTYHVSCASFGLPLPEPMNVTVEGGCPADVCFQVPVDLHITTYIFAAGCEKVECSRGVVGQPMLATVGSKVPEGGIQFFKWNSPMEATATQTESGLSGFEFTPRGRRGSRSRSPRATCAAHRRSRRLRRGWLGQRARPRSGSLPLRAGP